ncbi:hypothetical protein [Photobacterium damselae]|uniref:hypothetical protein n=1 Tax=Photobacterium damselae TaxID=38293 RepID=UPI004067F274
MNNINNNPNIDIAKTISALIFDDNEELITIERILYFIDRLNFKYEHDFDLLTLYSAYDCLDYVIRKTQSSSVSGTYESKEGSVTVNLQNYDPSQCWKKAKEFLIKNPQYLCPNMTSMVIPVFGGLRHE